MHFSCSVDEKTSKFQISRKRRIVLCHIFKREDGTVGELVLQSPAPVPFHALTVWDAKLHDIKYVQCKHSGKKIPSFFVSIFSRYFELDSNNNRKDFSKLELVLTTMHATTGPYKRGNIVEVKHGVIRKTANASLLFILLPFYRIRKYVPR